MESEALKQHGSLQRAMDIALWMDFKYRLQKISYVVIQDKKTKLYQVVHQMGRTKSSYLEKPENYTQMSYDHIREISSQVEPLNHWEEIRGLFSNCNGELLRFILAYRVPLEKFLRYELACRGYDQNKKWVGFDKAMDIWLTDLRLEK